jgi:hypothetical protein
MSTAGWGIVQIAAAQRHVKVGGARLTGGDAQSV